jgi:hypothetical protein
MVECCITRSHWIPWSEVPGYLLRRREVASVLGSSTGRLGLQDVGGQLLAGSKGRVLQDVRTTCAQTTIVRPSLVTVLKYLHCLSMQLLQRFIYILIRIAILCP